MRSPHRSRGPARFGPIDAAELLFKGATIRGFWLIDWFQRQSPEAVGRGLSEVIAQLATGTLQPPAEAEYDLAEFRAAVSHAERPGRRGKVLLVG